ncbi:MAG: hypothetical protein QM817_38495 [Archangium sp.]
MRGFLLLLPGLLISACAQERTHPRIAEATTPVHVTVRVVDAEVQKVCDQPNFTDKVSCWFSKSAREGCTYVSVGEAADLPIAFTGAATVSHCDFQRMRPGAAVLTRAPKKAARIFFDPAKSRAIVHLGDEGWLLFLKDQRLLTEEQVWNEGMAAASRPLLADDTPDWSRMPTLLSHLDAVSFDLSSPEFDLLMKTDPLPEQHLRDALIRGGRLLLDIAAFDRAMKRLKEADQQQVVDSLAMAVRDGDTLALDWFKEHPQHEKALADALLEGLRDGSVTDPALLSELLRLDPKGLDVAACETLESSWHDRLESGYFDGPTEAVTASLVVIVTHKSKCDWVMPLLEASVCNTELRCGKPQSEETDYDPLRDAQKPLCTDAEQNKALKRNTVAPKDDAPEEEYTQYEDWGPLLLSAAKVQGPVPPLVAQHNARRLYAWRFRTKSGKVQSEEDAEYDSCKSAESSPDRWVCMLPLNISKARRGSCTLEVDDEKKTVLFVSDDFEEDRPEEVERPLIAPE